MKEEKNRLQDDYDQLKEKYEQLLKINETSKNQQTKNVIIDNNQNISKPNKKEEKIESKKEPSPIAKSTVAEAIKKIEEKDTVNKKESKTINNIISDVNTNINDIINKINNKVENNEQNKNNIRNEKEISGLDFYENLNTLDDPYGDDN